MKDKEEVKKILEQTEKEPDAFSENLIVDENGKPHSFKPGVAEGIEENYKENSASKAEKPEKPEDH